MTVTLKHHEYIKKLEHRVVDLESTLKAANSNTEYAEAEIKKLKDRVSDLEQSLCEAKEFAESQYWSGREDGRSSYD